MNILVLDDEPLVLEGLMGGIDWNLLNMSAVFSAKDIEQAKTLLKEQVIEILLTDIEMGNGNGLDLIQWVRQECPETKCIVLSCHDEFGYAQRAVKLGCFDYILKPVPYDSLTQVILKAKESVLKEKRQSVLEDYGKAFVKKLQPEEEESDSNVLEKIDTYIRDHISEDFSVEALAGFVHVSPRHMNRLIRQAHEMSANEYVTFQRMLIAAEMLHNPKISVTMVSDRVGYNNYSYFIRQFKKQFGQTPKEYQHTHNE